MSKRAPGQFEPRERDWYPTPRAAVLPLIPFLRAERIRTFVEPCCGDGRLVRHLESFGLTCVYAGDIATGQDALAIPRFDAAAITNPPYDTEHKRKLMHQLLAHFIEAAPLSWQLLHHDWAATKQAKPFMLHCSDVVPVGRVTWIDGTRGNSKDNFCWYRFAAGHHAGPIVHPMGADPTPARRSTTCASCGGSFIPSRSDARFCSHACRQRAYEERRAVR